LVAVEGLLFTGIAGYAAVGLFVRLAWL